MKNKKNKRTLLAVLLVLLIVVTSAFIGSFAKYITSRTVSDSARVAKFGLGIPGTIDLFSDSYTNVQADTDGQKIIAPGTEGQYQFEVTGSSEVAYTVSANVSVVYSDEWDDYTPLLFSINGTTWTSFADFQTDLSTALASKTLEPNAAYTSTQTIYWKWPFHTSAGDDVKDSSMGYMASTATAASVTVELEVIATQVD